MLCQCTLHQQTSFSALKDDKFPFAPESSIVFKSQLLNSCGHCAFVTARLNFDPRKEGKKRLPVRRLKDLVASSFNRLQSTVKI